MPELSNVGYAVLRCIFAVLGCVGIRKNGRMEGMRGDGPLEVGRPKGKRRVGRLLNRSVWNRMWFARTNYYTGIP